MDPDTLRAAAQMARAPAQRARADYDALGDRADHLGRLGASRSLMQLAVDIEVMAVKLDLDEPAD